MFRAMLLVFSFAIAGVGQAQTAVSPIKHLLVLAEEKGYLHEAVSHAAATIDVCRGDQVGDGPGERGNDTVSGSGAVCSGALRGTQQVDWT